MLVERRLRKAFAVTAAATGLAVAGLLGYEALQSKHTITGNRNGTR